MSSRGTGVFPKSPEGVQGGGVARRVADGATSSGQRNSGGDAHGETIGNSEMRRGARE